MASKSPKRAKKSATRAAKLRRAPPAKSKADASSGSKLDAIVTALRAPSCASLPELQQLTGWLPHSVRGALSGSLKKQRGLAIISTKKDGERHYRIEGRK